MGKNNSATERSICCNSKVKLVLGTKIYYKCNKCKNRCDIYYVQRREWIRNPKTQIIDSKKEKIKTKLTRKEIEHYRQTEDF